MTDSELLARIRLAIFRHFLARGTAPVLEQLMRDFDLSRSDAAEALYELAAARHLVLVPGTDRILMAWPFSAVATPFEATARGRTYAANCSWDAIAFHAMLGDEVRVDSFCHHCAMSIRILLRGGRVVEADPPEVIAYFALRADQWWTDIVTTCSNTMVFFASPEHRDASDLCAPGDLAVSLTPQQVHDLSGPIYGRKLELDYVRPSRDELLAHFARLGLSGRFWAL